MLAACLAPDSAAASLAGTAISSMSLRVASRVTRLLLVNKRPPAFILGLKASMEGLFMIISDSGELITGDPIGSSEITTVQLAVPPRISGPYDGIHVTCSPRFIAQ